MSVIETSISSMPAFSETSMDKKAASAGLGYTFSAGLYSCSEWIMPVVFSLTLIERVSEASVKEAERA